MLPDVGEDDVGAAGAGGKPGKTEGLHPRFP